MSFSPAPQICRSLLAVMCVAGLFYCYLCVRSFLASELADSGTLPQQVRATQLEPQNATYWRQLGNIRLYQNNDPEASLSAFRRATELNPRNADAWIGAAYALQVLDRSNDERWAISQALNVEPRRLEVIWQAANLDATLGDLNSMMSELCVLLAHDRVRAKDALALARRSSPNADSNEGNCDQETAR